MALVKRIAVIGGGAAGLMAAAQAARQAQQAGVAARVIVLEKNTKAGVKILMSGGTRCNLTHHCDAAGIRAAFGRGGDFLRDALATLSPTDVVELFHRLGVPTQVESTGKVFPVSNRAIDVRDALLRYATEAGVEVRLSTPIRGLVPADGGWSVQTDSETLTFDRVILTVGGQSWPGCGTTGDGYGWLEKLGHRLVDRRPALVPLVGGLPWTHAISGVTLDHVVASVWSVPAAGKRAGKPKKPLISRQGGFLFTHVGFSGPTAMDVSGTITAHDWGQTQLTLDLMPTLPADGWSAWLSEQRQKNGGRSITAVLQQSLPRRLVEAIAAEVAAASGAANQVSLNELPLGELPKRPAELLGQMLRRLPLPVHATGGFAKAEVTAGGLHLKEVDPRTMASRRCPGLYVAGEILDLDGWIGGYNFQAAFSTGALAGSHAARSLQSVPTGSGVV